jgi:hypothetical protein
MFRECPFKGMLKAQNSEAHIINPTQLIQYVRCEHDLFKKFVSEALMMAAMETKGNRHAQATHDGVTLKDKRKYQALGLNFSLMYRNWTIALGFVKCADGTSKGVASLYLKTFKDVTLGMEAADVARTSISDEAAARVNALILVQHPKEAEPTGEPVIGEDGEIDHDVEVEEVDPTVEGERCNMHKSDKIGASAVGHLVRKKNKQVANPFPGGKHLMKKQLNAAKYYSYTGGTRQGILSGHCKATNSPDIMPDVPINGTRIAAQHNLLIANLRLKRALERHHKELCLSQKKDEAKDGEKLMISPAEWQEAVEVEAILDIPRQHIVLSQLEKYFTGGYELFLSRCMFLSLGEETPLAVLDLAAITEDKVPAHKLARVEREFDELSATGKECMQRARLECLRKYPAVAPTARQYCTALLDHRLCNEDGALHFTSEENIAGEMALRNENIAGKKAPYLPFWKPTAYSATLSPPAFAHCYC